MNLIDLIDAHVRYLRKHWKLGIAIEGGAPPMEQRTLTVPAVFIEIDDIEPLLQNGDTRLLADIRFIAHVVVDRREPRAELAAQGLACDLALHLNALRRPLAGHGHIRFARIGKDGFRPELEAYVLAQVEWAVEIALGELEPPGVTPSEILFSWDPRIGAAYEPDYDTVPIPKP